MKIILNAKTVEWNKKSISYGDLVGLKNIVDGVVYTITYYNKSSNNDSGMLSLGKSVKVKDGMMFNVMFTGNA
jgi:hypothetical protein